MTRSSRPTADLPRALGNQGLAVGEFVRSVMVELTE